MARSPAAVVGWLLAIACVLALPACRTASSSANPGRPRVLRAGQSMDTTALELTEAEHRIVEAHARFAAGLLAEFEGKPEAATAHFEIAAASDPANEELTIEAARRLVEGQRFDEARKLLERSTARPEASGTVWGWLGIVHALRKDRPAAIAANQEAIRRTPKEIGAYQNLARNYVGAGQIQDAITVLEDAARQPDTDARFLLALADTLSAFQQIKDPGIGDLRPRIVPLLDRVAALNPGEPAAKLRLADLYQFFGEGTKALPIYESLLETDPDLPLLRERLAGIYLRTDDKAKAAEQLQVLSRKHPTNPLPHYFLGVIALETKRFDDAIAAFNSVLLLRPENDGIYFELAIAHLSYRRPADAIAILDRARAKFRTSFRLEFYTAAAYLDLKRYDDAIRHFTAAEVVGGAMSPHDLTAGFFFQSGVAYERLRRFDDAAVQFERAIEIEPEFAEALNYLGYMWAEQGLNLDRAHELIQQAIKLEPDNEAFLDSLAWVLHQLGRSAEALPHQLRAVELAKEPDATLFDHLGDIQLKLGRRDEARKAWERAQQIEAKPEVDKKLRELAP